MTDARVPVVYLGSGGFGRPALERLAAHPAVRIVGVVTAPPRPAGRHGPVTPTVIGELARELGLGPVLIPERLRAVDAIGAVLALKPALVVLADYGQIVPAALLGLPHGALNLHPSLLPRHRGATPIPAAILAGDTETGVTLMRMDAGFDTGPIVAQERVALDGTETTPALEHALAHVAADLLRDSLGPWLAGSLVVTPQAEASATRTRPLRREDGRLDPQLSAAALERQVRALQPWPGSFVETVLGRLVIWAASAEDGDTAHGAGETVDVGTRVGVIDGGGLVTLDGRLRLHEVQPAGGRRMPWDAYVRGRPAIVGSAVVSDQ